MNKRVDNRLASTFSSVCVSGHIPPENEVYLCAPQPGVSFVTGFNGYYKSFLGYTCMYVLYLQFLSFRAFLWGWGLKQNQALWGFSEYSHKSDPDLVWKLNLGKLSPLCHCVHEIPICAFDKLHWATRDIASSSSCSVELHTLIPLPTVRERDVVFSSPSHIPCMRQLFHHLAMRGKYPDSGKCTQ